MCGPKCASCIYICVHFSQFIFLMFNFVSKGEFKMLYFQVAYAQKFKKKMIFFGLLANMECCYQSLKIVEEMIHIKYQRATPEFPVFFILRCLKMHN